MAAEVAELLGQAQAAGDEENRRYGKDERGDELPQELAFREGRLERIREAMAALEAEAQSAGEQVEAESGEHLGVPDDKFQRNFTDAESRIMPAPGGKDLQQSCNCQAVVDHEHQAIVAARATNQASDKEQAVTMVDEAIANLGTVPKEVSPDAGYYSGKAVDGLCILGVEPFVAPEKTRHGRVVPPRPGVAYPAICLPGTGCDGSCRPSGVGSATLCGCKLWSRYSARSSRSGDSGSSCCGDWRRWTANGR